MLEKKDKAERRLKKTVISLMRNPKFALWSGILMVGETRIDDNCPTAYTNGRDKVFGRGFINQIDDKMLAWTVLHEALHIALRHLTVWRKLFDQDAQTANMAVDYVINLMLHDMDPNNEHLSEPTIMGKKFVLFDTRFKGMNAKQVFDILKQEQKGSGGKGKPDEGEGEGKSGAGFDEHGWGDAKSMSKEERQELEREVDQALRQGQMAHQKMVGSGGADMARELGDLLDPQVDWREVLREFVTSTCNAKDASSWRRVNRRFLGTDTYMPTMIGERVGHIAIGIDTSGSIGGAEINRFLSEVKGIAELVRPEKIDLIYWDARVAGHEVYDETSLDTLVQSTKPRGGGGTDPTCMMHHLRDKNIKPECIIMLTDGEIGNWGNEWEAPILWVVCNSYRGNNITAPVGKTVHITE